MILGERRTALSLIAVVLAVGCVPERGPAPGQLTVALSTNMTPGKDFDSLSIVVERGGQVVLSQPFDWPRDADAPPPIRFPATLALLNRSAGAPVVTVHVEAKQRGTLRIVRDAKVSLPTAGDYVLPLLIDWLCLDKIPQGLTGSSTATDAQCASEQTCIAGECRSPEVTEPLSSYDEGAVFGGADGSAGKGTCFDVLGTFDGSTRFVPETRSGSSCGIPWTFGDANLNVAVIPAEKGGICYAGAGGEGCFVPLDRGGDGGWSVIGARLVVPAAVCRASKDGAVNRIAVVQGKPTKVVNQPPCGSFSSVGLPDAGTPPSATIVVTDPDAGGTLDAAIVRDVGAPDSAFGADAGADAARDADAGGTLDAPACTKEDDSAFCKRIDAACGKATAPDNCGSPRTVDCGSCQGATTRCNASNVCIFGDGELLAARSAIQGANLFCGKDRETCGRSPLVVGGSFNLGGDPRNPAVVSSFRLDAYEVTVGRFRLFVDAWTRGWRPAPGRGKHAHLNGGSGLALPGGGFERGWEAQWTAYVRADGRDAETPTTAGAVDTFAWTMALAGSDQT